MASMNLSASKRGAALKMVLENRKKLQDQRVASYRRKDRKLRDEDRKDPVYREAINAYQREYRKRHKEAK
jgi:hypothetical protein